MREASMGAEERRSGGAAEKEEPPCTLAPLPPCMESITHHSTYGRKTDYRPAS